MFGMIRFFLLQWLGQRLNRLHQWMQHYGAWLIGSLCVLGMIGGLLTLVAPTELRLVWAGHTHEVGLSAWWLPVTLLIGVCLGSMFFQSTKHTHVAQEHLEELRQRQTLQATLHLQQEKVKQLQAKINTLELALQKALRKS
ncbi:MAG: hypothetical protein ACKO37_05050 [Vampirovibrionales bacterium]